MPKCLPDVPAERQSEEGRPYQASMVLSLQRDAEACRGQTTFQQGGNEMRVSGCHRLVDKTRDFPRKEGALLVESQTHMLSGVVAGYMVSGGDRKGGVIGGIAGIIPDFNEPKSKFRKVMFRCRFR